MKNFDSHLVFISSTCNKTIKCRLSILAGCLYIYGHQSSVYNCAKHMFGSLSDNVQSNFIFQSCPRLDVSLNSLIHHDVTGKISVYHIVKRMTFA